MEQFCPWEPAQFFIFSTNVPQLLFYSHVPVMVVALIIGLAVFLKSKKSQISNLLLTITLLFFCWSSFDLLLYATNNPSVVMFFWSLQILVEPLIYLIGLYLTFLFIEKREPSFQSKFWIFLLYLPIVFLLPTSYSLSGVSLEDCTAIENFIAQYYTYVIEFVSSFSIIALLLHTLTKKEQQEKYRETVLFGSAVLLFFLAFSWGNIIGSFSDDWVLAQVGFIGMPIFIGFLAYMIVKFKTFDIKLVGAQALIFSLLILIGSQFFFIQTDINRVLTAITLIITGAIGTNLVRSVKKEVALREHIEKLAKDLESANDRLKELDTLKSEFVSMATHQLRAPLTAIKGYASMLVQGDYGLVPENIRPTIDTILESSNALAFVVNDFLDVSRIEQGRMKYEFSVFDLGKLVYDVVQELDPIIARKGLKIKLDVEKNLVVRADIGKMRQVIGNLIDNSVKYTPSGSIFVLAERAGGATVQITIKDTGVGIKPETLPKLFQKFSRAEDASKANILGTGLGLYVAKQLITAQGGKVWAESEGEGKGSTFVVELPLKS